MDTAYIVASSDPDELLGLEDHIAASWGRWQRLTGIKAGADVVIYVSDIHADLADSWNVKRMADQMVENMIGLCEMRTTVALKFDCWMFSSEHIEPMFWKLVLP